MLSPVILQTSAAGDYFSPRTCCPPAKVTTRSRRSPTKPITPVRGRAIVWSVKARLTPHPPCTGTVPAHRAVLAPRLRVAVPTRQRVPAQADHHYCHELLRKQQQQQRQPALVERGSEGALARVRPPRLQIADTRGRRRVGSDVPSQRRRRQPRRLGSERSSSAVIEHPFFFPHHQPDARTPRTADSRRPVTEKQRRFRLWSTRTSRGWWPVGVGGVVDPLTSAVCERGVHPN